MYSSTLSNKDKLNIRKGYVVIDGFVVTQQAQGTNTGDVLVRCWGQQVAQTGDNCTITNNEFRNAAIGLKFNSDHSLAQGNLFINMSRTGVDILNGIQNRIINNEVANTTPANSGIYDKGGSRNTVFNGNYIHSSSTLGVGIMLGGSTGYQWVYRPTNKAPDEAFNSVALNNVVIGEPGSTIRGSFGLRGCDTCMFSNNISVGAQYVLSVTNGGDPTNSGGGGTWTATNHNPSFVNNIAINCSHVVTFDNPIDGNLNFDYNLLQSCSGVAGPAKPATFTQTHGQTGDPLFVNLPGFDFHLRAGSPALSSGQALSDFPTFSDTNTSVSPATPLNKDKAGLVRSGTWNLGIY